MADIPTNRPSGWASNGGGSRNDSWSNANVNWNANGFRLPTEHEWQWAAMGAYADTTATYTGTGSDMINTNGYRKAFAGEPASETTTTGDANRAEMVNYANVWWQTSNPTDNTTAGIIPVGQKLPNELGIYDMSGNAFEWCWDWVAESGGSGNNLPLPSTVSPLIDYKGIDRPATGPRRLGHGGDWFNFANGTGGGTPRPSVWDRTGYYEYTGYDQSGMRVVMNAQ